MRILFGAATFPNQNQPWVLSWIVEAMRNGADVHVFSLGQRSAGYQSIVDDLRLLERTTYARIGGSRDLIVSAARAVAGLAVGRGTARRGLKHVMRGRTRTASWASQRLKNLAMSPLLGLPDFSLIHSHAMHASYHLLTASEIWRAPLVVTFHGLTPEGVPAMERAKQMEVFERAALFLANTSFARDQLASLGCPASKIAILPQGVDLSVFEFMPRPHPGPGALRILTVGRLHPDKGHVYMLEALRRLHSRGRRVEYHLVGSGPYRAELESHAQSLGIRDLVHFHGELGDARLLQQYREAHVFVLPSVRSNDGFARETQGLVLQEAQACGKLVVATRTGGVPEGIDDRKSGFLVNDRDSGALEAVISELLDSPDDWPALQEAARRWVEDRYSMPVLGLRAADIYCDVAAGRAT